MARALKILAGLVLAGIVAWVAWWIVAARGQEAALAGWLEDRAAEGWQAEADKISVVGFPDRFDRRVACLALADPEAGWAWAVPLLDATSPAWDPTRIDLALSETQSFAVPGERVDVEAARFGGVFSVVPGPSLALREASIATEALEAIGQSGWGAGAAQVSARIARRTGGTGPANGYDIDLEALEIRLPARVVARLDPSGQLGSEVGRLSLAAQIVADRQIDRYALEQGELGAETVVIRDADLQWDNLGLGLRGRLDADEEGFAEGEIEIEARQWQRLLDVFERSGAVGPNAREALEGALGFVALLGGGDSIEITLGFSGGRMRIGPVPLADAPRLVQR